MRKWRDCFSLLDFVLCVCDGGVDISHRSLSPQLDVFNLVSVEIKYGLIPGHGLSTYMKMSKGLTRICLQYKFE